MRDHTEVCKMSKGGRSERRWATDLKLFYQTPRFGVKQCPLPKCGDIYLEFSGRNARKLALGYGCSLTAWRAKSRHSPE